MTKSTFVSFADERRNTKTKVIHARIINAKLHEDGEHTTVGVNTRLKDGTSKTVWVKLNGNSQARLDYMTEGKVVAFDCYGAMKLEDEEKNTRSIVFLANSVKF